LDQNILPLFFPKFITPGFFLPKSNIHSPFIFISYVKSKSTSKVLRTPH
ncbi:hypothetical protein Golob_021868, partial [Gossypium lobatum]|nr:hypothetical protein [Gossypium lobatum]